MDFTLGVEEEFQIIDPESRELCSHITQMMEAEARLETLQLKKEMQQSVVEVGTGICANIQEVRRDVVRNRQHASRIARAVGMRIGAAGTHPISRWQEQAITADERYQQLADELQDVGRANLIFGMHVHVGIDDREEAIAVFNNARLFLPLLLALSTSSPFFGGRRTGLKSTRSAIFKRLPRTDIPEEFESYTMFQRFVEFLVETGCVDDGRRIWWDIRPHATFSTVEFRICDLTTRVDETVCLAALCQAIAHQVVRLHRHNQRWRPYRAALLQENKWRAMRYGIEAQMVDFGRRVQLPMSEYVEDLLDAIAEDVDALGSRREVEYVRNILREGTSADRQLRAYEKAGDLKAVVDLILEETLWGVAPPGAPAVEDAPSHT